MTDEPDAIYARLRTLYGARRRTRAAELDREASQPFDSGRDPQPIAAGMAQLTRQYGWDSSLARADLLLSWPRLVGEDTARRARPIGIEEGVLVVRCDSTAWATQLRRMQPELVTRIHAEFEASGIEAVRVLGPETPSWKHGPRSVPGRGPRDTYG
jgi:predicted nucleic acid-binding Zn ribbon protein